MKGRFETRSKCFLSHPENKNGCYFLSNVSIAYFRLKLSFHICYRGLLVRGKNMILSNYDFSSNLLLPVT